MSLIASEGQSFVTVEPGTYAARCIRLIDIGTQSGEYQGKETKRKQVIITWELPLELIEEGEYAGQPYVMSKFYSLSLDNRSNLRKDLAAWRGRDFTPEELKGFYLENILDKPCMLSVHKNDIGKIRIGAVMAMPKGMVIPTRTNDLITFDISEWDANVYDSLPDGIKKIIQKSTEYVSGNDIHDTSITPICDDEVLEPF